MNVAKIKKKIKKEENQMRGKKKSLLKRRKKSTTNNILQNNTNPCLNNKKEAQQTTAAPLTIGESLCRSWCRRALSQWISTFHFMYKNNSTRNLLNGHNSNVDENIVWVTKIQNSVSP
ncbi:hypothetical protein BTR25_19880 [Bacillus sp. MRMR6]|nr:hypothetical protein BTR25_19880 [Bacillus sp. MRMR6]